MKTYCYPVPYKRKSLMLCEAFAEGCGGEVVEDGRLRDGPAMFAGVMDGNERVWLQLRERESNPATRRGYVFLDNAYFDSARESYFRVTKNALQHSGIGHSDGLRFAALDIPIKPWRTHGDSIIICAQSSHYMRVMESYQGEWALDVLERLRRITRRSAHIRPWQRNKSIQAASLPADLKGAHALVTFTSAAAVTAVLAGVPVVCLGDCAASPMSGTLEQIERPFMPDREEWAGVLGDNQFTLAELASGMAWRVLNARPVALAA